MDEPIRAAIPDKVKDLLEHPATSSPEVIRRLTESGSMLGNACFPKAAFAAEAKFSPPKLRDCEFAAAFTQCFEGAVAEIDPLPPEMRSSP